MRRIATLLLCALTITACAFGVMAMGYDANAEGSSSVSNLDVSNLSSGISFDQTNYYDIEKPFEELPRTMEAVFTIKTGYEGRSGILVGNHRKVTGDDSFNFELQWDNNKKVHYPKIYYIKSSVTNSDEQINFNFTGVSLTAGTQYHLAIVHDTYNQKAYCYVNGALKQTIEKAGNDADYSKYVDANGNYLINMTRGMRVGGDYRDPNNATKQNACYFKGAIKHIAFYSDVRTATEITGDYRRQVYDYAYDDDLMLMYDFTRPNPEYLKDIAGNGYDIKYTGENKYASVEDGLSFGVQQKYVMKNKLSESPSTYEAVIYLPKSVTGRGGVIVGNYEGGNTACYSFEITDNGGIRLYFDTDKNTGVSDLKMTSVDVRTGDWAHVAVVHDKANNKVRAYINGTLQQEANFSQADAKFNGFKYESTYPAMVGGDWRGDNAQYFKGIIKSVALYDAPRTIEQIKEDIKGVDVSDPSLTTYYDMSESESKQNVVDGSGSGNDLIYQNIWIKPEDKAPVTDYAYTFAVVGDTQWMNYCYNGDFAGIYDWILDNKESKKIEYVFGVGDVTEKDLDWEWETAKKSFAKLDGNIPYSVVRGNHDTNKIHSAMNNATYLSQFDGFYQEGNLSNTYRKITIGGTKYLMITLDYGASDAVLNWAGNLCSTNPDHKVIISTHAYMYRDGTTLDQNDVCPPATTGGSNNGDHMWTKLVSKYENIMLVLSGHDPCDDVVVRQERGINGNMVTQMLIDHQYTDRDIGGNGMVTLLYFSADGSKIEVECYSTVRDMYFKSGNQFTICANGHEFSQKVADDKYLSSPATCAKKATYYFSCKCGEAGVATFESGDVLAHEYDKQIVSDKFMLNPASCAKKATYYYSCVCGKAGEDTFEVGEFNPATHLYDQKVTTEKYFRSKATCTTPATYYYSCVCGSKGTIYFESGDPSDEHEYNEQIAEDKFLATPASCTKKATYYYSCECGEKGEETFTYGDLAGHEYDKQVITDAFVYKKATCTTPAIYYYSCDCGAKSTEKFNYGEADGHNFADQYDCHDRVCADCNITVSATGAHSYDDGVVTKQPTATAEGEKKFTCACGATKTEKIDKLEGGADEKTGCGSVAPTGGNGLGGTALMLVTLLGVALVLALRKRRA